MQCRQCVTAVIILLIAFAFSSCSRSRTESTSTGQDGAEEVAAAEEIPADGEEVEDAIPLRLTDEGRARAEKPVLTPADPRDTAFEGVRFSALPFHVQDAVLGALGAPAAGSARDRAVLLVCDLLFSALLEGELLTDLLSPGIGPGGRAVFDDLIWQASTLSEYRLGVAVALTEAESSVPFRLMSESRYAVGEVILEKVGDQWYTADIQVDILDRDPTSRFDPAAVRSDGSL